MIADIKKRALHRARILEGQLRGVEKMIDDEQRVVDREDQGGMFVFGDLHVLDCTRAAYPQGVYALSMIADIKKRALHRARILEGQLRGVEKMIDDEAYCVDIITQTLAIQKSLRSLNKLLVENHLRTHVTEMFEEGGSRRDEAVDELLTVFELENRS